MTDVTPAWRRTIPGFAVAALVVATLDVGPFLAEHSAGRIRTWAAVLRVLSDAAGVFSFFYLLALMLVVLFGAPALAMLMWRRWNRVLAYAVAGALAADAGLLAIYLLWQLPADVWWWAAAVWVAVSGAAGGVSFRAVVRPATAGTRPPSPL
jgi:hypothetical protein